MRRYSPYYSSPRRGYEVRGRSPPRRGYSGGREQNNGSLLVRNIPLNCRFGPVRDVYLPKDYYTGEPRGFGFVQFVDPYDAGEAQYHMNRKILFGREITVVVAAQTRKRPEDMRRRGRIRGPSGYDGHQSYHGRSRSQRYSSRARHHSRSYSPAPRQRADYSASPHQRYTGRMRSPRFQSKERKEDQEHRSYSPDHSDANENHAVNRHDDSGLHDVEGSHYRSRSPRRTLASPLGSRSRSADLS